MTAVRKSYMRVEMWDEIFKFESFINFVNFLKYFKTPLLKFSLKLCILITINSKKCQSSLTIGMPVAGRAA